MKHIHPKTLEIVFYKNFTDTKVCLCYTSPVSKQLLDLFPLSTFDYVGTFLVIIGLIIAASGGIGGGGILVPLLILVFGFSPKHAIPLSTFTILGSSITNMLMNLEKRHPDADRPLIDWDLMMIMEPLTVGGAIFGAYLSKLLPEWLLTISLVLLLGVTAHRTLVKGMQQYKKESLAYEESKRSALTLAADKRDNEVGESDSLLAKRPISKDTNDPFEQQMLSILQSESRTPMKRVYTLAVMTVVIVVVNLLKGGGEAFPSPIGVVCGSAFYWFLTSLIFLWVVVIAYFVRVELVETWKLKKSIRYQYVTGTETVVQGRIELHSMWRYIALNRYFE